MSQSGHEYVLESHGYRAVITQAGATLRELQCEGRDLIVGFPEGAMASAGRGQHLIPCPIGSATANMSTPTDPTNSPSLNQHGPTRATG